MTRPDSHPSWTQARPLRLRARRVGGTSGERLSQQDDT